MARNMVWDKATQIGVVPTQPATPVAGDPVLFGVLPGVALTDPDADGKLSMKTDGAFNLSVKGVDGSGNAAITAGDIIYYVAADTPKLSVKTAGVRFGYAMEDVGSGATTTINVKVGY